LLLDSWYAMPHRRLSRRSPPAKRGQDSESCFFDLQDEHTDLHWLDEALLRQGCPLHAQVLVTSQVHLLGWPKPAASVLRVIIAMGRRNLQSFNHSSLRAETLWDGPDKSSVAQAETVLPACWRGPEWIRLRALMVAGSGAYPWCSDRAHAHGKPASVDLRRRCNWLLAPAPLIGSTHAG
jgi:putative transposase